MALTADPIFTGLDGLVAYYANSFICEPQNPGQTIATTQYETETFAAGVRTERAWGVQFHPEKSSAPGLRIIQNFLGEIS